MDAIGAAGWGGGSALAVSPSNGFSDLTSEDFVRIMFTELTNQDPLAPNDSQALLEQMSSLRSIQSDLDLQNKLDAVVTQNQLASAANLIGDYVVGLTEQSERVADFVVSVSRTTDGPVLNLESGYKIPFDGVIEIIDGDALAPGAEETGD